MKIFNLGLYEKSIPEDIAWEERLTAAKDAGFDFLEISVDESDVRLQRINGGAALAEIKSAIIQTSMPILTMCLSAHRRFPMGSEDAIVRQKSLEIMRRAIDMALELGVRIIQIAGYDEYYKPSTEKTRNYFEESLAVCVQMAAKSSIMLAFETMETNFMNTVAKAMHYIKTINSPYLQVYPDLGNITNALGDAVVADLLSGCGHIAAIHLKETKPGIYREVPYGEGHVDFRACIETALSMGVRTFVTEYWFVGAEGDWKTQLLQTYSFFNRIFQSNLLQAAGGIRLG